VEITSIYIDFEIYIVFTTKPYATCEVNAH